VASLQGQTAAFATSKRPLCFSYMGPRQSITRNILIINASYFNRKFAYFGPLCTNGGFVTADEVFCQEDWWHKRLYRSFWHNSYTRITKEI